MFKKIILLSIISISGEIYGMPVALSNIKDSVFFETESKYQTEKENWNSFFNNPSSQSLDLSLYDTSSLAFKKAYHSHTMKQKKHYKAQYQLILISFACEYWFKNPGIEDDEFNIAHAIASAFSSFYRLGFDEDLTQEERSYYEKIAGKFFKKYYELYPEKLKSESELYR